MAGPEAVVPAIKPLVLAGAFLFGIAFAQDQLDVDFNSYFMKNGVTILIPSFDYKKEVNPKVNCTLKYGFNRITAPPVASVKILDGVSGASRPVTNKYAANEGFTKYRNVAEAGFAHQNFGMNYYLSHEVDYLAQLGTVNANMDFNQKNTNVSVTGNFGFNDITPLGLDVNHKLLTYSGNLTLTQSLTPKLIGRVGVYSSYLDGFQSNPYRAFNIGGTVQFEKHPENRRRDAVFLKLSKYFETQSSIQFEYRYYQDDWRIKSHTGEVDFHQYLSDYLYVRYRYRYYVQTGSYFFREVYPDDWPDNPANFYSTDYKMGPIEAQLYGIKFGYRLKGLPVLPYLTLSALEAKYDGYFNSNDFVTDVYNVGLKFDLGKHPASGGGKGP